MPKRNGKREAEKHTKSGKEEAKGGEEMTEQDAIKAVLAIQEFCKERGGYCMRGKHDVCPFIDRHKMKHKIVCVISDKFPVDWDTEGLKHDD